MLFYINYENYVGCKLCKNEIYVKYVNYVKNVNYVKDC